MVSHRTTTHFKKRKTMKILNDSDKAFSILLLLCLLFWISAKTPIALFIPFGIVYEATWIMVALTTVICSLYFFYKWIKNRCSLFKIHVYGFLTGIITLLIMRFM
jgi:hypothetical protein